MTAVGIMLGTYAFDDARTTVTEKYEEVGGRDARVVQIKGLLDGLASVAELEAALDQILALASEQAEWTPLSLREGRWLQVRRTAFVREVNRGALVGSFTLTFEACDPCETGEDEREIPWAITASGQSVALPAAGTAEAPLRITLQANGNLLEPVFSDGVRQLLYWGTVQTGQVLVLDGAAGCALLNGQDVTPYTQGLFPRVRPGGSVLRYTGSVGSTHAASATVAYRDRWW